LDREHLIPNEMQPDSLRGRPIEEECPHGLPHILTQLPPGVALREDVLSQAFGAEAAVSLLCDLENQLSHLTIHPTALLAASRSAPQNTLRLGRATLNLAVSATAMTAMTPA